MKRNITPARAFEIAVVEASEHFFTGYRDRLKFIEKRIKELENKNEIRK